MPDFETLLKELKDPEDMTRRNAAVILGNIRDVRAAVPLIEAYGLGDDETGSADDKILEALVKIGKPAVGHLINALRSDELNSVYCSASVLGKIRDRSAVQPLIRALHDLRGDVRLAAVIALGELGDSSAIPALIETFGDSDGTVRGNAAIALGEIGDRSASPILISALHDGEVYVRANAAESLGMLKCNEAIKELIRILSDDAQLVWGNAVKALRKIGQPAIPDLVQALKNEDDAIRRRSVVAIMNIETDFPNSVDLGKIRETLMEFVGEHGSTAGREAGRAYCKIAEAVRDNMHEIELDHAPRIPKGRIFRRRNRNA